MKKIMSVALICVLLVTSFSVLGVQAASPGQTSTSILVQNLSTSAADLVAVDFYNTAGTHTGQKQVTGLCGECTVTFDQRYSSGDPGSDPFQGAAIVQSDQPIGAVVQEVRSGGSAGVNSYEAYNGIGQTAKEITAPLILRGINSAGKVWNTFMSIQNTSTTASANVTVTFTPDPVVGLGNADTMATTIPAGGSWYIEQVDQSDLGTMFFGSAKVVSSDQDVAVVVNSGTTDGAGLIAYPTYVTGSSEVYLPGAMKDILSQGDNFFTSVTIVNMGTSPVDVTVEYQPVVGTAGAAYTINNIATATTVDQRYDSAITSATFFGAVKLSVSGSGSIAAMLNTRGDRATTGALRFATTYSGFPGGDTTVFAPYLLKYISSAGYNWSATLLVQNLDPGAGPLNVSIVYKEDPAFGSDTFSSSVTVDEFASVDLRYDTNLTEGTFYGGAKLTASRPFGVAVLVRGSGGSGDALSSYLGIAP